MKTLEKELIETELVSSNDNINSLSKQLYREGIMFYVTLGIIGTCAVILYNAAKPFY